MADCVKALRELLNDPKVRNACGIPDDAEVDESALDAVELWCDEKVDPIPQPPFISLLDDDNHSN